jgi:hypothetical protein
MLCKFELRSFNQLNALIRSHTFFSISEQVLVEENEALLKRGEGYNMLWVLNKVPFKVNLDICWSKASIPWEDRYRFDMICLRDYDKPSERLFYHHLWKTRDGTQYGCYYACDEFYQFDRIFSDSLREQAIHAKSHKEYGWRRLLKYVMGKCRQY